MSQELPDGVELPSYTAMKTAAMILSDCGHSTNNTQLHERVARRVDAHSDAHAAAILADREKQAARVPDGYALVPLDVLKAASESLGSFVSDLGWGDADMQAMDNLDAFIAAPTTEPSKAEQADAPSHGREEIEAVIACLGDDAAQLREENPEDERADNMECAAELLRAMAAVGVQQERRIMELESATKPQAGDVAQDSARLDWLESVGMANIQRMRRFDPKAPKYWDIEFGNDEDTATGPNLRAAIDAARTRGECGGK